MREVRQRLSKIFWIITVLLVLSYLPDHCYLENYSQSYQLLDKPNGSTYYRLSVTAQQSLYEYYAGKSHKLNSNNDFAKFVTPHALKPVADSLWEIYADDEDFANAVLMIVHQISYVETLPAKYPVETIIENEGDCDLFSFIAASIMKAGGLDVVLLYYEHEAHMNIGVSLSHVPSDARMQTYYFTHNDVKYYVAECTGENWQGGWRVGECPDSLKVEGAQIVTLESCEQWAPGQVSASYKTLESSTISLSVSSTSLIQDSVVTLSGQLSPPLQDKVVTIYFKVNDLPWAVLDTAMTDSSGRFTYVWDAKAAGICHVRASWSGDDSYAGADSSIVTMMILSTFFVLLLIVTVVLVCVGAVVFFISRLTHQEAPEHQPPRIP